MDDEQGPWWTRPPEPGPQAPPVQRRRLGRQREDKAQPPTEAEFADATATYPPTEPASAGYPPPSQYTRPRLVPLPVEPELEPELEAEPEPEPAPAPQPAKPVVRRVAVVPPAAPPAAPPGPPPGRSPGPPSGLPPASPANRSTGRNPRDDQTETLPPVGDGIFATFSGPLPQGPNGPPATGTEAEPAPTGLRRWIGNRLDGPGEDRAAGLLPQVTLPEPRVLLLAAAAALVVLLIVIVALVSGRGNADPTASASVQPSPVAGASALQGRTPDGLKQVSALDAAAQLRKAGQGPGGSIVEAWGWNDRNGRNLVVTSVASAGANKRTLRVIHVAGLDGEARTLRVMKDPNLPANCRGAGTAGFTSKALIVRDLDSNNMAEVITGWTSRCGGREAESQIRLALITNGNKYILRGQGVIGQARIFTPAPRPARWPNGYLKMLTAQYQTLYGEAS